MSRQNMYMNGCSSIICNSPKLKITQMSIAFEWINKVCCIHTMENYSAIKRKEILT